MIIYRNERVNFKIYMKMHKIWNCQKSLGKKVQSWELTLPDFKHYHRISERIDIRNQCSEIKSPEVDAHIYVFSTKMPNNSLEEMIVFSTNNVGKIKYLFKKRISIFILCLSQNLTLNGSQT